MAFIKVSELNSGDILIGDSGNHSVVNGNLYTSSSVPGITVVETEHGSLYMDPDMEVEIADE